VHAAYVGQHKKKSLKIDEELVLLLLVEVNEKTLIKVWGTTFVLSNC